MRYRNEKFLLMAKKSARPNNSGLVSLTEDPITQKIVLPDETPVNVKPFYKFYGTGDLGKLVRLAESRASTLCVPQDCILSVFYRQHGVSDDYTIEYYALPKNS